MLNLGRRFHSDESGNFAIMSTILAVPLVMATGVALDLSTISRTRAELQQAMDAAVLAVARDGKDISDAQAEAIARLFVANNYHLKFTKLAVNRDGSAVTVDAHATADVAFGGLFGYSHWPVVASSTADIAYASYEIALVLDTTGSMAGGKLQSMKDAVDGLIESMSAQIADPQKLRFALVPFATFVNVGPEHGPEFNAKGKMVKGTGATWLDLKGQSDVKQTELVPGLSRFEVYHQLGTTWSGCVETRAPSKKGDHDVDDTPARKNDKRSLFIPAFAIDEPAEPGFDNDYIASDADPRDKTLKGKLKKLAKYGIDGSAILGVGGDDDDDDDADDDENDDDERVDAGASGAPVTVDTSRGKGPGHGCATQPLTPLSSSYADLRAKVKALTAHGTTNIMEGVAWGMRVLSPGEPFAEGRPSEPNLHKIMIVLTDGSNVMGNRPNSLGSSYSSFGYLVDGRLGIEGGGAGATTDLMNKKTLQACANAKADGVEIYTIRLEEPDVKTGTMLAECATSPAHFFDAPSRQQLDDVFKAIRDGVVRLRMTS